MNSSLKRTLSCGLTADSFNLLVILISIISSLARIGFSKGKNPRLGCYSGSRKASF